MRGMGMNASCCQFHGRNAALTPVSPFSSQQVQRLAFVPHQAGLQLRTSSGASHRNAFEAPPLKFPPGGAFALRIYYSFLLRLNRGLRAFCAPMHIGNA